MADQPGHPPSPDSSKAWPGISIVVPVYQGEALIGQCLDSLLRLDYPRDLYEIILVDNASTDRTAQIAQSRGIEPLYEARQGAAIACNTGWRRARFDLVAFTDADCVVEADWLRQLAPHLARPGVGGCGGCLNPSEPRNLVQQYIIDKNILSQERALEDRPGSPPFVVTANVLYSKAALEAVGGFEESLTGAGYDADIAWRIQWAGYTIAYEPRAVVWHYHRATLRGFMRQLRGYGSGEAQLFAMHHRRLGLKRRFNSQPYRQLLRALARMPWAALAGKDRMARALPALEFLDSFSYLRGKIGMSLRKRMWYF